MRCSGRMLITLDRKKDRLPYLCDNLCWKIASENRILVLLVAFCLETNAQSLVLTNALVLFPNIFLKQRLILYQEGEHGGYTMMQFDTFTL